MHKILFPAALFACFVAGAPVLAAEKISPTKLNYIGDCVAAVIYAPRSTFQKRLDKERCSAGNASDSAKINACMKNIQERSRMSFFTDRCGNDELPFYISLNGVDYELHLVEKNPSSPVYFAGRYVGQELEVEIEAGPLLRKIYEDATPPAQGELTGVEYRVLVTVKKDSVVQKIPGVFWSGH